MTKLYGLDAPLVIKLTFAGQQRLLLRKLYPMCLVVKAVMLNQKCWWQEKQEYNVCER